MTGKPKRVDIGLLEKYLYKYWGIYTIENLHIRHQIVSQFVLKALRVWFFARYDKCSKIR